ncbi:hypothetical protein [Streptomyces antimycoticus]|uniref:hypothetical protein n=1 Tax=Streptomyces antimycoticus TaxID=68175 RepID=UPI0038268DC3
MSQAIISAVGPHSEPIKVAHGDCRTDMPLHQDVTATGLPVYFATRTRPGTRRREPQPYLVREYPPKVVEIASDPHYLAAVAAEINDRPRKIHDWMKPGEIFTELLETDASTT